MTIEEDYQRYLAAAHAMQTGVAFELERDPNQAGCTHKHLRVGINSAMIETDAITRLLIAKGIFTEEEQAKMIADCMEEEAKRYEQRLREEYDIDVKLL